MEAAARERRLRLEALRTGKPVEELLQAHNESAALPVAHTTTVEEQVTDVLEAARESLEQDAGKPLSLADLAPKKANQDLKDDLASKMSILEEQTQEAIKDIVRDRLKDAS